MGYRYWRSPKLLVSVAMILAALIYMGTRPSTQLSTIDSVISHLVSVNKHPDQVANISLVVRMSGSVKSLLSFFFCTLLRTLTLYWSRNLGDLSIILDKEVKTDHLFAENLKKYQEKLNINFNFLYEPPPSNPRTLRGRILQPPGYNRQLFSSFIMDLLIPNPIIAWVDTDTKFTAPVGFHNIFNGQKLRVKGMNTFQYYWIHEWSNGTQHMIGKPMISDFMTYFPVYIWRDTVKNCRNYILKYMNLTNIEDAYFIAARKIKHNLSPVNIILTYAFYFEKDRYDWHLDIRDTDLKTYNKLYARGTEVKIEDMTPEIHVSLHDKYYKDAKNRINRAAYCAAINHTTILKTTTDNELKMCKEFNGTVPWFLFESCNVVEQEHLKTWCKNENPVCVSLINDHYSKTRELVKYGVYDLNLRRVLEVEKAAKSAGVQCKPFV